MYPYRQAFQGVGEGVQSRVRLRDCLASDYPLLARWDSSYYDEVDRTEVFVERQFASEFKEALGDPKQKILVAQVGDNVAGFIWVEEMFEDGGPLGYITNIHIDKRFRNIGLAQYLLNVVEEYFRSRNIGRLQLEVCEDNTPARHIYLKNGYTQVGDYLEKTLTLDEN